MRRLAQIVLAILAATIALAPTSCDPPKAKPVNPPDEIPLPRIVIETERHAQDAHDPSPMPGPEQPIVFRLGH